MSNKSLTYGLIVVGIIAIVAIFTPIVKKSEQAFGNVINGNWTGFNGVWVQTSTNQIRYGSPSSGDAGTNIESIQRIAMTSGTTSPCSILSPAATSTLLNYSMLPTVGTTTSATLVIATGTTPYSITPAIAAFGPVSYVPMNSFTAVPTTTNVANIPPLTYVNLGLTAATASGGYIMTGFCTADFLTQ